MLSRLWGGLLPGENSPTDITELKRSMETVIDKASEMAEQEGLNRVIIIIDALNQMDDDGKWEIQWWLHLLVTL